MNKNTYLNNLRSLLNLYDIPKRDIDEIITDYTSLWEGYQANFMTDEDINAKLGHPNDIIHELTEGYQLIMNKKAKQKHARSSKLIAITPFIALPLFFLIGFAIPGGWLYAWIAFLLIPMTAILTQGPNDVLQKLTALSPFIALIIFFVILGPNNLWYPGWLVFLIIPAIGLLNETNVQKKIALESLLIIGVLVYLSWFQMIQDGQSIQLFGITIPYAEIALLPFILYLLIDALIKMSLFKPQYLLLIVVSGGLYIWISLTFNLWVISWLVFFIIPVYAIVTSKSNDKLIALMPFISTSLFMILGYYFNWWAFAWMVYLLITVTAILKGK